ncbi:MAG: biotin--[acetyl-CoA-carboxylase] ligase [Planctomycetes bacterium]|nr:biotin--[acetyl-CoA-carboxylase] ligase [Planctomycetota bacterium]
MTAHEDLEKALQRATRFRRLVHSVSCSSTQDLALADALAAGATPAADAIFWTDHQEHGRGRQQREWHDEPGADLLATFRVRERLPAPAVLPAALPAAAVRAIERFSGRELRIKWPNDVYFDGRKLAGMLIDSGVTGSHTYLIGVGVNCNRVRFPPDLEVVATSMALLTGQEIDRGALLGALAESIDAAFRDLAAGNGHELLELLRNRLGLLGRDVEVTANDVLRGELTAIDFTELELDGSRRLPLGFVRGIRGL